MLVSRNIFKHCKAIRLFNPTKRNYFLGYDNTNIDSDEEDVTTRIYKKYAPARTVLFNHSSKEGKMAKVFTSTHKHSIISNIWTLSVPVSAGIAFYMQSLAVMNPLYFVTAPVILMMLSNAITSRSGCKLVSDLYLLHNGDQALLKTYDGVWHKICIQDIKKYRMNDKKKHLQIDMKVGDRVFVLSTKNKTFVNFEVLDKIIKGICIQTNISNSRARPPAHLNKEGVVKIDVKKALGISTPKQKTDDDTIIQDNFKKYGIPEYNERDFYATFKISRTDFISKIEGLEEDEREEEVLKLYEARSIKGRNIDLNKIEKNIQKVLQTRIIKPTGGAGLRSI
jgi:hypothetical protein